MAAQARDQGAMFQARTGNGSRMFVHLLDFDANGDPDYFAAAGARFGCRSVLDGDRGEAAVVLCNYLAVCSKLGGAHRFALNDELQQLNAAGMATVVRSDFWVQRQSTLKKLYAAVFPVVQRLCSPATAAVPAGSDGASSSSSFAVYNGPTAREEGTVPSACTSGAAGTLKHWADRSYLDAATGLVLHIWSCPVAARGFVAAQTRTWQSLFEHRMSASGMVCAPMVALVGFRGLFVTAMPAVPVTVADATSVAGSGEGSVCGTLSATVARIISGVQHLNSGHTNAAATTQLDALAEHQRAVAAAVLSQNQKTGALLRARDGRFYYAHHFACGGPALIVPSGGKRHVALRPEALAFIRRADGTLFPVAGKKRSPGKLSDVGPELIGEAVCCIIVPLAVETARVDLEKALQGGSAKGDGGLGAMLSKLATTEGFVTRQLRQFGVNMAFLGHAVAHIDGIAERENVSLDTPYNPADTSLGEVSRGLLVTLRHAFVFEIAVRCAKHMCRAELYQLHDAEGFANTNIQPLVDRIHRVMALAANDHPSFWGQLDALAHTKFAGLPSARSASAPTIKFSLQLVKVLAWHVSPKFGLAFDQGSGRFNPKFACVSLGTGALPAPDLMRMTATGNTTAVAETITREWDMVACAPCSAASARASAEGVPCVPHLMPYARLANASDGSLAIEASSGKFNGMSLAALGPSGGEINHVDASSSSSADPVVRFAALARLGFLELLVRWANKQQRRLEYLRSFAMDCVLGKGSGGAAEDALVSATLFDLADTDEKKAQLEVIRDTHLDALDELSAAATRESASGTASAAEIAFVQTYVAFRRHALGKIMENTVEMRLAVSTLAPLPDAGTRNSGSNPLAWGPLRDVAAVPPEDAATRRNRILPSFTVRSVHTMALDLIAQCTSQMNQPAKAKEVPTVVFPGAVDAVYAISAVGHASVPGLPAKTVLLGSAVMRIMGLLCSSLLGKRPAALPAEALDRLVAWFTPMLDGTMPLTADGAAEDPKLRAALAAIPGLLTLATLTSPQLLSEADERTIGAEVVEMRTALLGATVKPDTTFKATMGNPAFVAQLDALVGVLMCPPPDRSGGGKSTPPPAPGSKKKSGSSGTSSRRNTPPPGRPAAPRKTALRLRTGMLVAHAVGKAAGRGGSTDFVLEYRKAAARAQQWLWRVVVSRTVSRRCFAGLLRVGSTATSAAHQDDDVFADAADARWRSMVLARAAQPGDHLVKSLISTIAGRFDAVTTGHGYVRGLFASAFMIVLPRIYEGFVLGAEELQRVDIDAEQQQEFAASIAGPFAAASAAAERLALEADEGRLRDAMAGTAALEAVDEPVARLRIFLVDEPQDRFGGGLCAHATSLHHATGAQSIEREQLEAAWALAVQGDFDLSSAVLNAEFANFGVATVASAEARERYATVWREELLERELLVRAAFFDDAAVLGVMAPLGFPEAAALLVAAEADVRYHSIEARAVEQGQALQRDAIEAEESTIRQKLFASGSDAVALFALQRQESEARTAVHATFLALFPVLADHAESLARATLLQRDYGRALLALVDNDDDAEDGREEGLESIHRRAVVRDEEHAWRRIRSAHLDRTIGIALERVEAAEEVGRSGWLTSENLDRVRHWDAAAEATRDAVVALEARERLGAVERAETSMRSASVEAEERRDATIHFAICAEHYIPAVVGAAERPAFRALVAKQCERQKLLLYRAHVGASVLPLVVDVAEPSARRTLEEDEATLRSQLRSRLAGDEAWIVARNIIVEMDAAAAIIAMAELKERSAVLVEAHRMLRDDVLWREQMQDRTRVIEAGETSGRHALLCSERRVLRSQFILLVLADRQRQMAKEHEEFAVLRGLRNSVDGESAGRAKITHREADAWEELLVQDVVWRSEDVRDADPHNSVDGMSPWRRRALERTGAAKKHPNALKQRPAFEAKKSALSKPRWQEEQEAPDLKWLHKSFTPPPIAKRTFDEQRKRQMTRSLSPTPKTTSSSSSSKSKAATNLRAVLAASRDEKQQQQRQQAARASAAAAVDDARLTAIIDVLGVEAEERGFIDEDEAAERRAIVTVARRKHGPTPTKLTREVARTHGKVLQATEAKRRESIEFDRERDVVLMTVSRREALAGGTPEPKAMPGTVTATRQQRLFVAHGGVPPRPPQQLAPLPRRSPTSKR